MKHLLAITVAAVLAAQAPWAVAETMYKCVAANGKVAYSSVPCEGQAREAKQFAVPPPEPEAAAIARHQRERIRLRVADAQFRQRQGARDAGYARQAPRARSAASLKQQAQQDLQAAERAQAAKLNAARIGNCTTRRLEANCL